MLKWLLTRKQFAERPMTQMELDLGDRVHRLEMKVAQQQELHEQLQGHHDKLRSKIWGYIGATKDEEPRTRLQGRVADQLTPGVSHADILQQRALAQNR